MIKSFSHKGLKLLFEKRNPKLVVKEHEKRLIALFLFLHTLDSKETLLKHPKYRHVLKGNFEGKHSMVVSGNWRVIFDFDGEHIYLLDYLDYH